MSEEYKVGDVVVITTQGDGDGCDGGPAVGTVAKIEAVEAAYAPACGQFLVSYDVSSFDGDGEIEIKNQSWWTTSEHFLPHAEAIVTSQGTIETEPVPVAADYQLGATVKSLHPGSETLYRLGHVRVSGMTLRFQGKAKPGDKTGWETDSAPVSSNLRRYIKRLPHVLSSVAGTSTKYAACQFRLLAHNSLRVQIAGPPVNREWGVEFEVYVHQNTEMLKC